MVWILHHPYKVLMQNSDDCFDRECFFGLIFLTRLGENLLTCTLQTGTPGSGMKLQFLGKNNIINNTFMSVVVWIFWHPRVFVSLCHALITCSRHGVLRWWISVWLPGLSSNKEVSAEPILACAEHCFTHERVARETLYNQMVDDAPSWWGDGDEDGDAAFFLLCFLFCGCVKSTEAFEASFTGLQCTVMSHLALQHSCMKRLLFLQAHFI